MHYNNREDVVTSLIISNDVEAKHQNLNRLPKYKISSLKKQHEAIIYLYMFSYCVFVTFSDILHVLVVDVMQHHFHTAQRKITF